MVLTALWGATSGVAALGLWIEPIHHFIHGREPLILAASAILVLAGGGLEMWARRAGQAQGFPWLFTISALCFAANAAIITAHRL